MVRSAFWGCGLPELRQVSIMRKIILTTAAFLFSGILTTVRGQDSLRQALSLKQVFQLALSNSVQLKVSEKGAEIAKQRIEIDKLGQLPALGTGFNYGYLSNADIWTPGFSKHIVSDLPHHLVDFTISAGEVIFKGNEIKNDILKSGFEEQVARLAHEKDEDDIKLLVTAKYLDIYRLINTREVYQNNIRLAQNRLRNVLTMKRQGMVTENDVLRTKLTISDLRLAVVRADNDIRIDNRQLNMVTGLPDSARLVPDSTLLRTADISTGIQQYLDDAFRNNHELKIAATESRIAETNVKLAGADRYPELSIFAESDLQRPYLNSTPAQDVYYNAWEAGISLSYNIGSLYQSRRKIKASKLALEQTKQTELLQTQNLNVNVSANFIKFNEAKYELKVLQSDLRSAEENYRIVERKYFNQLALLTDMIDATNTKIEAELSVTNAQINVVYTYYQLLKSVGTI